MQCFSLDNLNDIKELQKESENILTKRSVPDVYADSYHCEPNKSFDHPDGEFSIDTNIVIVLKSYLFTKVAIHAAVTEMAKPGSVQESSVYHVPRDLQEPRESVLLVKVS